MSLLLGVYGTVAGYDCIKHIIVPLRWQSFDELLSCTNADKNRCRLLMLRAPCNMLGNVCIIKPFAMTKPVALLGESQAGDNDSVQTTSLKC